MKLFFRSEELARVCWATICRHTSTQSYTEPKQIKGSDDLIYTWELDIEEDVICYAAAEAFAVGANSMTPGVVYWVF